MFVLILCASLPTSAQSTNEGHFTSPAVNQFIKVSETGEGLITDLTLKELLAMYPGSRTALESRVNSNLARAFEAKMLSKTQLEYAEAVDSVMAIRAKIAILEYLDCTPDDSWQSDSALSKGAALLNIINEVKNLAWDDAKPKIEKAMAAFDTDIRLLQAKGAPERVMSDWKHQYRMLEWSIKLVNESFLPNSQRKNQFDLILADINERDRKLKLSLKAIASMEYIQAYTSGTLIDSVQIAITDSIRQSLPDKSAVARASLDRWKQAGSSVLVY